MRALNNFIKFLGYVGIYLIVILQAIGLALIYTAPVVCIFYSVLDIFKLSLPEVIQGKFWAVYLLASLPLSVAFSLYIIVKTASRESRFFTPTSVDIKRVIDEVDAKIESDKKSKTKK